MKLLFKPLNLLASTLGGILAGLAFSRLWTALTGQPQAPAPDSTEHRTGEVLVAAALQGALFAAVKAAVDRAGAQGARRVREQVRAGAQAA